MLVCWYLKMQERVLPAKSLLLEGTTLLKTSRIFSCTSSELYHLENCNHINIKHLTISIRKTLHKFWRLKRNIHYLIVRVSLPALATK